MDSIIILIVMGAVVVVLTTIFFVSRGRRREDERAPLVPPLREEEAPVVPPLREEEAPVVPPLREEEAHPVLEDSAAVPEQEIAEPVALPRSDVEISVEEVQPAKRLGSRLTEGLGKTRGVLAERLSMLTKRDRIDEDEWDEIEEALIRADVGVKAATRITKRLREAKPTPATLMPLLRDQLVTILTSRDPGLSSNSDQTNVWLVTGVNGVGKTTSIAKLAHRLQSEGTTTVIAAADTFRAAAIDQLGTWADRAGVHMVKHAPGADPGAVVFDAIAHAKAKGIQVVIVDTAGRIHTKSNLMEELKKVYRIAEREAGAVAEVLLVLDATVGQNGIAQAKTFQEAVDVTGVILTKLDGSARGGVVIAIQEELGIPVKAVGVGETMEDLEPFHPEAFVTALLGPN